MEEWTVVTVVGALASFLAVFLAPVLKLNSAITRLNMLIDGALKDMKRLESADEVLRKSASESHRRLHARIDENEEKLQEHEKRIVRLELES